MQDYPAAHSMDTHWFAVDADGNIGYFDSSEGGAVPITWQKTVLETRIEYVQDFLAKWQAIRLAAIAEIQTLGDTISVLEVKMPGDAIENIAPLPDVLKLTDTARNEYLQRLKQYQCEEDVTRIIEFLMLDKTFFLDDWILQFSSEDSFNHIFRELNGFEGCEPIVRFTGNAPVFYVYGSIINSNISLIKKLVQRDKITEIKLIKLPFRRDENPPHELGLFPYVQDSSAPLPYEKMAEPIVPLRLDDLPEELQDSISWTWFDTIRFAEADLIQPIEHMPCHTWGSNQWWVDTAGQEHDEHPHY